MLDKYVCFTFPLCIPREYLAVAESQRSYRSFEYHSTGLVPSRASSGSRWDRCWGAGHPRLGCRLGWWLSWSAKVTGAAALPLLLPTSGEGSSESLNAIMAICPLLIVSSV